MNIGINYNGKDYEAKSILEDGEVANMADVSFHFQSSVPHGKESLIIYNGFNPESPYGNYSIIDSLGFLGRKNETYTTVPDYRKYGSALTHHSVLDHVEDQYNPAPWWNEPSALYNAESLHFQNRIPSGTPRNERNSAICFTKGTPETSIPYIYCFRTNGLYRFPSNIGQAIGYQIAYFILNDKGEYEGGHETNSLYINPFSYNINATYTYEYPLGTLKTDFKYQQDSKTLQDFKVHYPSELSLLSTDGTYGGVMFGNLSVEYFNTTVETIREGDLTHVTVKRGEKINDTLRCWYIYGDDETMIKLDNGNQIAQTKIDTSWHDEVLEPETHWYGGSKTNFDGTLSMDYLFVRPGQTKISMSIPTAGGKTETIETLGYA